MKPSTVSVAEAANLAVSGSTAMRALRKGQVRSGDHVLVVGASGGVGTFAVQLAKTLGAQVAGVCSTTNVDLVRSLGADDVIDYTKQDFTRDGSRYDVILDMAGNRSLSDLRRALGPGGTLVMVGQSGIPTAEQSWLKALSRWLRAAMWSPLIDQRLVALVQAGTRMDLLLALAERVETGEIAPAVTSIHPLCEAPEVIDKLSRDHSPSQVVIEFSS